MLEDALRSDIGAGRAALVVGAGVSLAATSGAAEASWLGLIRAGMSYARATNAKLTDQWQANVESDLELGHQFNASLVAAAGKVLDALGGTDGGDFKAWLRRDVGGLSERITNPGVLDALTRLPCPLLTTNYDGLLEKVANRSAATWRESSRLQMAITRSSSDIGHLHGYWEEPSSVILGASSYGEILGHEAAQALQQAIATTRVLVFVGFGAGMQDPNFDSLRHWLRKYFAGSELRHYRLCLIGELEQLAQFHSEDRISPVPYGAAHDDLEGFLLGLREHNDAVSLRPATHLSAPTRALEAIHERVRGEALLVEHVASPDTSSLKDLLIPPVILPITHEQFVSSHSASAEGRPRRCDPAVDARQEACLLLAAEENVGLTSALEWLVAEHASQYPERVPVIIDFRQLGAGPRPLSKAILKELRLAGVMWPADDALPPLALALDNVSARPSRIFDRVASELRSIEHRLTVLGCRQGSESELAERLEATGLSFALRYLGRLNRHDTTRLATLVAPSRAKQLASRALEIVTREHLQRTPFTLGLLISALLHGEALLATASETALLDAYVNLLLGRGDPHDDARFSLDSHERSDILANLAESFVVQNTGSLSEAEVVEALASYFDDVDWNEDPLEVLRNLTRRHLLIARAGQVRFGQASYLHLFAAKRAMDSESLRVQLFADPVYYAPIIRHYAALTRNDSEVLARVESLLWAGDEPAADADGARSSFAESDPVIAADSVEELLAHLQIPTTDRSRGEPGQQEDTGPGSDWLDSVRDEDQLPFPLTQLEEEPPAVRVMAVVGLVSNVLRDSELVRDHALKQRILHRTVAVWGHLVLLLERDTDYVQFLRDLGESVANLTDMSEARRVGFIESLLDYAPLLTGYISMSSSLSSRKLARSLDRCWDNSDFSGHAPTAVMGALLAFDLQEEGWTRYFAQVRDKHPKVKAVAVMLRHVALLAYYYQTLSKRDSDTLHDILVDQLASDVVHKDVAAEKTAKAQISQRLRANRARAGRQRLEPGQTIFASTPGESDGETGHGVS